MNTKPDGGPAFPQWNEETNAPAKGISIRDWFAGMALLGYRAANVKTGGAYPSENVLHSGQTVSKWSYSDADAMLAERERTT